MKTPSSTEDVTNIVAPAIYRLQVRLGIQPRDMCLITGCPRSGTSAVFYWLKTQKKIAGFYESRILISAHRFISEVEKSKALRTDRKTLIKMMKKLVYSYYAQKKYLWRKILVEKEPLEPVAFADEQYEKFLENVIYIFPEIKIIFMVRDPIAVVWSMINRKWGESLTKSSQRNFSMEECVRTWKNNIDLMMKYSSYKNTYICVFEKLINDSKVESQKIFRFLSILGSEPFMPKPTKISDFSQIDCEFILSETRQQREVLSSL